MKIKDQSIETLRGIAIILVVAGYIIGDDLQASHSSFSSALHFTYYLLKPIRMPLFTVISAYLYASSPATQDSFKKLISGKTRRILIPYIVVSAMQYIFFSVFHVHGIHPLSKIYTIYIHRFEQFWFLWAIFWIFLTVGFLDSLKLLETKKKWLGWLALLTITHITLNLPVLYGIIYLFPFFLMGYGIRRFSKELFTSIMIKMYLLIAVVAYAIYIYLYGKMPEMLFKLIAIVISFSAVPLIFHFRQTIPLLANIGSYAFGIHIFNKISTALARMLFEHFHVSNEVFVFWAYLGCGILLSIGFQILSEQFSCTKRYVLGMKEAPRLSLRPIVSPSPLPASVALAPATANSTEATSAI
jgi:hypothetical protein